MTPPQGTLRLRNSAETGSLFLGHCPDWLRIRQTGLIASIGILLLLPVWIVRYPPLVDYPNHLARYYILGHLQDPNLHLSQFYASRWQPSPYVAVDVLAVFLLKLLPIDLVGRLILSISLLGLPLASYVFLRQISYESRYLAAWALVISYGPVFLVGFVNVTLSAALCFWLFALFLKYLNKLGCGPWLGLLILAILLYFTHLVGFVIGAMIVFTYCVLTRQTVRHLFAATSIFVPGAVVYLVEFLRGRSYWLKEANPAYRYEVEIVDKFAFLTNPFRGYSRTSTALVLIGLIGCLILAVWKNRDLRLNHPWLGVTTAAFVVYLLSPANFHHLEVRIFPFLFILSLSVAEVGPRARVLGAIGLLVFVVRCFDVDHTFISRQDELEEWHRSFEAIPPNSRILPMVPQNEGQNFRRYYEHFWAYGVIERGWFSPNLFHSTGIHPLALNSPADDIARLTWFKDPYVKRSAPVFEPDWPEIQRRFDYLWVFDLPRFSAPISRFGQLVYSGGPVKVFRVLPISPPGSGPTTLDEPNQRKRGTHLHIERARGRGIPQEWPFPIATAEFDHLVSFEQPPECSSRGGKAMGVIY
jgi:hypothetical protein